MVWTFKSSSNMPPESSGFGKYCKYGQERNQQIIGRDKDDDKYYF